MPSALGSLGRLARIARQQPVGVGRVAVAERVGGGDQLRVGRVARIWRT